MRWSLLLLRSSAEGTRRDAHYAPAAEKLSEQHNVRLRPSTKARLLRAVDKLRYETGDRSINISSVTDAAIIDYLTSRNC